MPAWPAETVSVAGDRKSVLVTGAGRRLGRAMALDLAAHGWTVGVHYLSSRDEADAVVGQIIDDGGQAAAIAADLSDLADTESLVARTVDAIGPLTCLINNASLFEMDTVETVTPDSWQAHLDTNLRAPALLTQAFAAQLPAGGDGNVINVLDQRVWRLTPYFLSYTTSKSGLWTLTRTTAMGLAPRIRVNAIGPGPTLPSSRQTEAQFDAQCRATPLGRGASPAEICAAVRFILAMPSMTGQMIALDGGQHLVWQSPGAGDSSE